MIKRIHFESPLHGEDEWPEVGDPFRNHHLYSSRKPLRRMRVLVDFDVLDHLTSSGDLTMRELLTDLLEHPLLSVLRYADGGPPSSIEPDVDGIPKGWAVVEGYSPGIGWTVIHSSAPGTVTRSGILGNEPHVAARDVNAKAYFDLTPNEAARRRQADGLAAQVAKAVGRDVFITERPYLRSVTSDPARGVTICSVEEALGVLGLYFRAQGEFLIRAHFKYNRGLYYWVGTRELLPNGWRWFGACVQHSVKVGEFSMTHLGGSVLQRFDRALEARDQIHIALNQAQDNDTHDTALATLDVILVLLMGALDAAARVAHRVLKLPADGEYRAGWQTENWIKMVRQVAPALAAVVDRDSSGHATLTILRLMRNSVHGTALQGLAVSHQDRTESLVGLPERDRDTVSSAMDCLGGAQLWGARAIHGDRFHLDPGVFVDRLVDEIVVLLNELMSKTPVEQLPNVALTKAECLPPEGDERGELGTFAPRIRRSIRWQLGVK